MRDPLVLLKYECGRRPELARLVADIDHLSDAAIDMADLAQPWMHNALHRLKEKNQFDALAASVTDWSMDGWSADPIGVTRQWQGDAIYIRVGRTELLMKPGQLIWLDSKGVWIDTIHTTHIDPKLTQSVFRARMSRSEYNTAVREQARGLRAPTAEPHDGAMFRFFRPG